MHTFLTLLLAIPFVRAGIYVTEPIQSSSYTGGQSYTATWIDDGQAPLLGDIGECAVALYTGSYQFVQSLPSVDVSTESSLSFTPNPDAGPDGQYYLVFTATNSNYQAFSGSFALTGMSGTVPGGGSSTPATTPTGSSTSAGSSTPGTSATDSTTAPSASTPSGASSSIVGTTTPTDSTSVSATTTPTGTTSPTPTTHTTASITTTSTTSTSASASASPSNAALRAGSSTSLGGAAALLVLSGLLAF